MTHEDALALIATVNALCGTVLACCGLLCGVIVAVGYLHATTLRRFKIEDAK